MSQKQAKTAAELENIIMAELREYPECEAAGVAIQRRSNVTWDAALLGGGPTINVECRGECRAILEEVVERLRQQFDLAD